MDFSLFFAGTGGSVPTARRGLPAILVRRGGDRILFDCGEGTQRQLLRSIGLTDVDEIFVTHLHADHWLGLPGLLKTFDLRAREQPLTIHGPRGLRDLVEGVMRYAGRTSFELHTVELDPEETLERDGYEIYPVRVQHRGAAYGYVLHEYDRPGTFDPDKAQSLGLVPGPEFGQVQRGQTVNGVAPEQVMGPTRYDRKVAISGDTKPCEALTDAAFRADLLVHESTFAIDEAERAHQTGHSTAAQAAGVAREAEVKMLALTHFSIRYPVRTLRDEARAIFPNTVLARDFDMVDVPFPERGAPQLRHWSERGDAGASDGAPQAAAEA